LNPVVVLACKLEIWPYISFELSLNLTVCMLLANVCEYKSLEVNSSNLVGAFWYRFYHWFSAIKTM